MQGQLTDKTYSEAFNVSL